MTLEKSQTLSWLLEELNKTTDVSREDLTTLLQLIHPPTNLHLLFQALKNLPFVLSVAHDIYRMDTELFPAIDFAKASVVCGKLVQAETHLSKSSIFYELFPDPCQPIWPQLLGILESHPLFSCLCFQPRDELGKKTYQHLLAQIFIASQVIASSDTELSSLRDNFLSVRKLAEGSFKEQLLSLPAETLSALDYLSATKKTKANTHVRKAGLILQHAYQGARRRSQPAEPAENRPRRARISIDDIEDDEYPEDRSVGGKVPSKKVLTKRRAQQYADKGGSKSEFPGGRDEVPVGRADEKSYSGATLRELAYQGKQRSNQEAMKNQFSPLGWNELNEFDLHILLRFLQGKTEAIAEKPEALRDLLSLMFWLSAPLERVLRLGKLTRRATAMSSEGIYLLEDKTLVARLHSPGPPLESTKLKISSLAHPVSYYSHIPLPRIAHSQTLVEACLKSFDIHLASPDLDIEAIDEHKRQLRAELNHLNGQYGTRLSLGRISHYWLHALGMEPGEDPPSSLLFFGHLERFSVARLHYTCAPASRMETTYRRIVTKLLGDLDLPDDFPQTIRLNRGVHLGTPLCPKPESIQELIESLRRAVDQSRPTKKNLILIKNFHNHYAIYTALMIAFATSYRAVKDPSLSEKDIHFPSGLGVISDKDDEVFYHSRFVWIANVCRQQIEAYRRHVQRLYELFALKNPALFRLFNNAGRQGRPLKLFYLPRTNSSLKLLRPGLLEGLLLRLHGYDLPVNAHRHYLKHQLLQSGCSPEIFEAQLGHWENGQEPWNRFSNLHPKAFCRQMDLHLTPILERDGWKVLEGYSG